jgi:FMN-dependent NADH-azoreductase
MKILHVEASPRGPQSVSRRLAKAFIDAVAAHRPQVEVDGLNLWREALPAFDGAAVAAKYARLAQRPLEPAEASAWQDIAALVRRLAACDVLVISTPMWNFGIPYRLKHWFDLITQPGLTFAFDPAQGYRALLPARPVAVILSSAGDYAAGPSWGRPDLASGYLRAALGFIGLEGAEIVKLGPTAGDPAAQAQGLAAAQAELEELAARWRRAGV